MPNLESEIREFCRAHVLRINTDLGQHFLVDQEALDDIVSAAALQEGDTVVEIGPGLGVLTRELLKHVELVKAIELDKRLIPLLEVFTESPINLEVIQGNALHTEYPEKPYKIVANIPYHITSPLLRHAFLESQMQPTSLTLLIQREVAERICNPKDAGMLTILVGLFGTPRIVRHVPPKAFLPPPKVESSVLHVDCFTTPKATPFTIERMFNLTKIAFSQKRKKLSNSIGTLADGMERMEQVGIDPNRRPQTLSVDEWIALAET